MLHTLTKNYAATTRDRLDRNLLKFFVWLQFGADGWEDLVDERRGNRAAKRNDPRKALIGERIALLQSEFLKQGRIAAIDRAARYRDFLQDAGYAPSTVNGYLWAVREMVSQAKRLDRIDWTLKDVEGVPSETLRDTQGISLDAMQRILGSIDRSTTEGQRNYALVLLLYQNALRRGEVVGANIGHLDPTAKTLSILGKGRRTRTTIDLSASTVEAIQQWLSTRGKVSMTDPLFSALDRAHHGSRLSGTSIYRIVRELARAAGVSERFSPHKVRHTAITNFLDLTDGNLRAAQSLSRHKSTQTLVLYDDRRHHLQRKASLTLEQALIDHRSPKILD